MNEICFVEWNKTGLKFQCTSVSFKQLKLKFESKLIMNSRHSSPGGYRVIPPKKSVRPEVPSVPDEDLVPLVVGKCFLCGDSCQQLCQWCRLVFSCCPAHFRIHRNKSKCGPYVVFEPERDDDERGRSVVVVFVNVVALLWFCCCVVVLLLLKMTVNWGEGQG